MKFYNFLIFIFLLKPCQVPASISDVISGTAKHVLETPRAILDLSLDLLLDLPTRIISEILNDLCSPLVANGIIRSLVTPKIEDMKFELRKNCTRYSYGILNASELWRSPEFDPKKKVVLLATGWINTVNVSKASPILEKAFNCRDDVNFVVLDSSFFVTTLYTWASLNTEAIGNYMAKGLVQLLDVVPLENIHLIGHSLGAHIVGYAGKNFTAVTGRIIPHITGLDPANPCFKNSTGLSGLEVGDADFIDIVHSTPGVLGKREPVGNADFYSDGLSIVTPDCIDIACAHEHAVNFYAESVYPGNENNFMGTHCSSFKELKDENCSGSTAPMGYAVPQDAKGIYVLTVNPQKPYGLNGNKEKQAEDDLCGVCNGDTYANE